MCANIKKISNIGYCKKLNKRDYKRGVMAQMARQKTQD